MFYIIFFFIFHKFQFFILHGCFIMFANYFNIKNSKSLDYIVYILQYRIKLYFIIFDYKQIFILIFFICFFVFLMFFYQQFNNIKNFCIIYCIDCWYIFVFCYRFISFLQQFYKLFIFYYFFHYICFIIDNKSLDN